MIALFMDTVRQTPCALQCVQPAAESWLKWLLPTIVQTVISLLSIGAGVGIAVWSFRKNRRSEHEQWVRNQKAGHEQWILDQKRAEWRELLKKAAKIEHVIPAVVLEAYERFHLIVEELVPATRRLLDARASCVFISEFLSNPQDIEEFTNFIGNAARAADSIKTWNEYLNDVASKPQNDVRSALNKRKADYDGIRDEYLAFTDWLRSKAQQDLGITKLRTPSATERKHDE
jgi:hypothetical protein